MRILALKIAIFIALFVMQSVVLGKTVGMRTQVTVAKVRVATAKLRKGPTESGRTLGLLDHAATLQVVSSKPGWVRVVTKRGTTGWVRRDLLSFSQATALRPAKAIVPKVAKPAAKVSKRLKPAPKVAMVNRNGKSSSHPVTVSNAASPKPSANQETSVVAGQLPEEVRASRPLLVSDVDIVDPIAEKRMSVVDFAQVHVTSAKGNSPVRSTLMSRANSHRGTPYRYGSSGGGTFDCSGFTSAMYRKVGVKLPRTAGEQFGVGQRVSKSGLSKGDLVFFRNTAGRRGVSHVGIYSGNGMFIHASSRGHAVRVDTLATGYYANHFAGGRRLLR